MRIRTCVYVIVLLMVMALTITLFSAPAPAAEASEASGPVEPAQQESNPRYSVVGIVDAVDEDDDCVYFVASADGELHVFCWRGILGYEVGDVCSLMVENAGPGVENDRIIAISKSGWNVAWVFKDDA